MTGARILGTLMLALFWGAALAAARTPSASELGIWQSMKHNADALQHYVYRRRTEVTLKGEPRGERVDLIRTVDGRKEAIPLETPEHWAGARQGRGFPGKIAERKIEKKREEMKGDIERLKELTNSYLSPDPNVLGSILQKV